MTPATEGVFRAALAPPEDQRLELVRALVAVVDSPGPEEDGLEAEWEAEAGRRLEDIVAGRADGRPLGEFLAENRGRRR